MDLVLGSNESRKELDVAVGTTKRKHWKGLSGNRDVYNRILVNALIDCRSVSDPHLVRMRGQCMIDY